MRVASVSFWHLHGTDYASEAQRRDDIELVALWDADHERGMVGAAEHGIAFVRELDEILDDPSIEGVIVCAPTSEHTEIVVRCIRAGKHVFMEKVLSADLEGAKAIVDAARTADVALTVSLWRSDRGYARQLAELVADGVVGDVTSARIRDGHPFALAAPGRPSGTLPERFYDPVAAQGGALIDLCHPLYLLALILGLPSQLTSAFGHVTGRATEDNAAVLLSYPDGALAIAETTYVSRITPFSIEIHGTEGSILYSEPGIGALVAQRNEGPLDQLGPDDEPRLRLRTTIGGERGWQELEIREDSPSALAQWITHVANGTRADANLALALELSALVEAAYRSAADGRATPVDAVWLTHRHV
ncbi:Gfo/Idh/MocA family protein [Microbacterium sp. E-13]|uniref:Gfo/Idh/MocA family protein n=1 Tax=Microbacterium sp. E-13 TaxID=3404048 RepID=UPI003CF8F755